MTRLDEPMRPMRGKTLVLTITLSLAIFAFVVSAGIDFFQIYLLEYGDIDAAYELSVDLDKADVNIVLGSLLVGGLVLVDWLLYARANAERATAHKHRRGRAFVVLGWLIPIISFWFPKQIVDDIWLASHPSTPLGGLSTARNRWPSLTLGWWSLWLVSFGLSWFANLMFSTEHEDSLLVAYAISALSDLVTAAAGLFLIRVVWQIGEFQEYRRSLAAHPVPIDQDHGPGAWPQLPPHGPTD